MTVSFRLGGRVRKGRVVKQNVHTVWVHLFLEDWTVKRHRRKHEVVEE